MTKSTIQRQHNKLRPQLKPFEQTLQTLWPNTTFEITSILENNQHTIMGWAVRWTDGPTVPDLTNHPDWPHYSQTYNLKPNRTLTAQGAALARIRQLKTKTTAVKVITNLLTPINSAEAALEPATNETNILATLLIDWLGETTVRHGISIGELAETKQNAGNHYMTLKQTAKQLALWN